MHHNLSDTPTRVRKALKLRILPAIYSSRTPVAIEASELDGEPVDFKTATARKFHPFAPRTWWGKPWGTTWFHFAGEVPSSMEGRRVDLLVDLGFNNGGPGFQSEGLTWSKDGVPIKGVEPRTTWIPIAKVAKGGEKVDIFVEAASNARFMDEVAGPNGDLATALPHPLYQFAGAELGVFESDVYHLALDIEALMASVSELPENSARRQSVLRAVSNALDIIDRGEVIADAAAARAELAEELAKPANASSMEVTAVGHAHIDTAWLWPIRETIRKCSRTFSNVSTLLDEHPDAMFACSQAVQYDWMKQRYPHIYARMAAHVKEGRWIPVGGMWVESDAVMISGESLVRQFLEGQRYFREEFGITCEVAWLPDSFGYAGGLPQICRLAGTKYFLTQKMSWNTTNVFPHSTFWWEGIDGTRVLAHFPPSDTYSSSFLGFEMEKNESNFKDLGYATHALMPYGYGDGGGGPTREMVELARRMENMEGAPRVIQRDPLEFFRLAEEEFRDAPVWTGEMYLEFHRGVWTSQYAMKRGNRLMEQLLVEAEIWSTRAFLDGVADYPYDQLQELWRHMLVLQFHDILPGSSIAWVHNEARDDYAVLAERARTLIDNAVTALAGQGATPLTFNASPFELDGIPAFSAQPTTTTQSGRVEVTREGEAVVLSNGQVRVEVAPNGTLTSITTNGREVLAGTGNQLHLHPDHPNKFDAWDIDAFYRHTRTNLDDAESVELLSDGVRVSRRHDDTALVQTIRLAADSPRLDFTLDADWHEDEKLLKVAFPLDVHASHYTAETQFGHVTRPTNDNTSWEAAMFEACAHRWLHISEPGFGVALTTLSSYGHDVTRPQTGDQRGPGATTVRLSLLRAPKYPDPNTDRGQHHFAYSLVLDASIHDAVRTAWQQSVPPRELVGAAPVAPVVTSSNPDAVVAAVKLASDKSGDVIVRIYESSGGRTATTLTTGFSYRDVEVVNLLEDTDPDVAALAPLKTESTDIALSLRPFQIVTLRFTR